MRRLLALLILTAACSTPASPSATVAGTWAENFAVIGASLTLNIDNAGNGSGTYAIEAGRSGTVQVTGRLAASAVMLSIRYDTGLVRTFDGALGDDGSHLTGTFDDSAAPVVFTRR